MQLDRLLNKRKSFIVIQYHIRITDKFIELYNVHGPFNTGYFNE